MLRLTLFVCLLLLPKLPKSQAEVIPYAPTPGAYGNGYFEYQMQTDIGGRLNDIGRVLRFSNDVEDQFEELADNFRYSIGLQLDNELMSISSSIQSLGGSYAPTPGAYGNGYFEYQMQTNIGGRLNDVGRILRFSNDVEDQFEELADNFRYSIGLQLDNELMSISSSIQSLGGSYAPTPGAYGTGYFEDRMQTDIGGRLNDIGRILRFSNDVEDQFEELADNFQYSIGRQLDSELVGISAGLNAASAPEPSSFVLFGIGALGAGIYHRRKRKQAVSDVSDVQ